MLIYTFQKSKKRKPNAKERQLSSEWEEIVSRHTKLSVTNQSMKINKQYKLAPPPGREPKAHYPSVTSAVSDTFKKESMKYTGTSMIGIATLHKSNAVPVFAQEEAIEISKMRRG